ncbi:nucleolin 1-like isoform X1 [Aricia agestis]|uniref:nucleolin 1-like isoform X1 n=1 Tax=Aricia agestis TaxID=91739 RepID=UPI001C204816|nr:nucleolin 1-like isoform X1 [Aricia agestis]
MEYVVGSVAALVSGNVTPSRPKHLKRALTPTKHQPSPNVTPKSELVDRSIFLSPTLQKKKAIAKKSPKRIFENQNLDVTEEDSILVSPKADKVKKHLEIELDANTSVNSSLLSPESPKDSAEMKKSPKKLKVMNAAAHVYENTLPKNNKRKLNEETVTKNVESNDASPNKKKKQERKPLSQDAANANQNGAQNPKKNKKQQQQEIAKPNQGKNIKPQNQVQNSQARQKPGQQNKNKAEKSEVQSPKKQNQLQNLQSKQKQKPAQENNKKPGQSAEAQSPKKQNQVQKTQAKQNQKAVQQIKNKPAEKSVEAQSPKKQNKKKNRKNKKNRNQSVPKPEPKVEAESEESDEDDDDDNENDDSIDPNTSSNIGSDSEDDSDNEVESGSDEDDDDENDDSINPKTSSNIGSDSDDDVESGSDEDDDDEEDNDDEENDDTVNPNAITNEDSDSEHDSDDEIESENDEANKQVLQPEESSDEEEEVKDTKNKAKKPEKKGKGPKVELTEEQKTEALEEEIKRTVFVGNVPFSKKCKKEIKKIFNEYGTIETIRIRTVPVKDATVTPKLAVIKNELHPERSTVNVYVKFADETSVEKALKANNTVLNGNHLRVHRTGTTGAVHDPKLSVFVGNIPFALEDEGLRAKFEKCGAIESVRIIRDRKTHAGKGFGYVNFESKDGVELALAMSEEDLTIKNRILRVKRCTHTEKKNKDKLPKKFVGNFQSNNKVQGDDGKKNNGAFRRIEMKRKLEARSDGPANKRANENQPRDKKQRKEFVGMTAEKKKKRKFDKGQKKKKVLGEILAKK